MFNTIYSVITFEGENFSMRHLKRKYFKMFGKFDFGKVVRVEKGKSPYQYWGVSENALQTSMIDGRSLRIQTKWDVPLPVFTELSKQLPGTYIGVEWVDSNDILSSNGGRLVLHDGKEITQVWQPPNSCPDIMREFANHVCWGSHFDYNDIIHIYGLDQSD